MKCATCGQEHEHRHRRQNGPGAVWWVVVAGVVWALVRLVAMLKGAP